MSLGRVAMTTSASVAARWAATHSSVRAVAAMRPLSMRSSRKTSLGR